MNRKRKVGLAAVVLLMALSTQAFSCNYHNLVTIEHDYKSAVQALQMAEQNEFNAGSVDPATHQQIQGIILKLAEGGQAVASLLQSNASKQSIAQQVSNISAMLQTLLANGVVGVKNPTTQANLKIMIQAVMDIVNNFATALGAPLPAPQAGA